jgi:hypothetical protein
LAVSKGGSRKRKRGERRERSVKGARGRGRERERDDVAAWKKIAMDETRNQLTYLWCDYSRPRCDVDKDRVILAVRGFHGVD